jgi:long-chain acyl-CoA synthetase
MTLFAAQSGVHPTAETDHPCTPARLFRDRSRQWAALPALRHKKKGIWYSVSWDEYYHRVRAVGLALADLGCRRGDVVAILAENRPEWVYADLGAQCVGMIGCGIYPTSPPEQVEHVMADSGARILFVENDEQLDKALAIRFRCRALRWIVVMDLKGLRNFSDPQILSFADLMARGEALTANQAEHFERAVDAAAPEDIAFLVYTSGTTGPPKGAKIANRSVMYQIAAAPDFLPLAPQSKTLSFLPLCHIAERMGTIYNQLALGQVVHFPENSGTVFNDLREVAPHVIFGPPRFWEKLHAQIDLFMRDAIPVARWLYRYALAEGSALSARRLTGRPGGRFRRLCFRLLSMAVLSNIRAYLGLGNVRHALTGAAPVSPDLLTWFMAIGVDLLEAYGATETTGFCTMTPAGKIKLGSAGVRAPGTELRIGAEDEILVRGANVFAGYWNMPEKTAETIDGDGWLHTGDCGTIDADGYLRIKDRIKDIIITSGGKNITPSSIETLLKFSAYIADAVVIGESRKYLTCLVMIDEENVAKFAQDEEVPFTDFADLTRTAAVRKLVAAEIEAANAKLARVEQLKDFRVIQELLTPEDEELTPTMKLKRNVVARKYAALIDEMYPE